jgi:hypothetical protein
MLGSEHPHLAYRVLSKIIVIDLLYFVIVAVCRCVHAELSEIGEAENFG